MSRIISVVMGFPATPPFTGVDIFDDHPGDGAHSFAFHGNDGIGYPMNDVLLLYGGQESADPFDLY